MNLEKGSMIKSPIKNWSNAKFKGWIISLLRRGTLRWPPRSEVLREARTQRKINEASGRLAQHYKCAICNGEFVLKSVQVNHKDAVITSEGFTTWDNYIERMFCSYDKLEVLCKNCHQETTQREKELRKAKSLIRSKIK